MPLKMYFEEGQAVKAEWVEDEVGKITYGDVLVGKVFLTKLANKYHLYFGYTCERFLVYNIFVKDYNGNSWGDTITLDSSGAAGQYQILRETAEIIRKVINGRKSGVIESL